MNKRIEIKLIDPDCKDTRYYRGTDDLIYEEPYPQLCKYECENILKEAKKINISTEELANAIVAKMYKTKACRIVINIDDHNKSYEPAKEMTLSEIEEALGYKVKIVNENQTQ